MDRPRIRIVCFSNWAGGLHDAQDYLATLPDRELRPLVRDPTDPELLEMARLDCDWDGECVRAFAAMEHPQLDFAPARVADATGLVQFLAAAPGDGAQPWLILIDQQPARVAPVIGKLLRAFTERGGRVLYWAYDDASRSMECFPGAVAPYLSVLIHDELPLADSVRRALPTGCRTLHASWVANIVPFAYPLHERPDRSIVFLGSKLGVTPHRQAQLDALGAHFKDRFRAITDHSVPVAQRGSFAGIKVHLCPEGRKFGVPTMSRSHTDRPFWAGCMGQLPVSEDSREGGRLDELVAAGLLLSYPHGDTAAMIERCEEALDAGLALRRRIHDHYNRHGTVGPVAAREIAAFLDVVAASPERPAAALQRG